MGILGFQKLQTDEVEGGASQVQMLDKICEWKIAHSDQQPIVVIRLKELLMSVIQLNVKAALFGGSHRFYHEQLDNFFQPLRDLNVKLVFFGGGAKTMDRLVKLADKFDQNYKKSKLMLKHIDEKNVLKLCARPELRMCLGLYEEGIARKYGEYIVSTGLLNRDIVQYCQENENVVAVLAKDSDFLVYSLGQVDYWSCGIEDLNFKEMTTVSFNHAALLSHLILTPYQFHVMVAIAGVILDDPKTHSYRVKKGIFESKNPKSIAIIRSISEYVRKNIPEEEAKPNFGAWATMMFTSRLEEYCWLIEKKFKKYEICTNKNVGSDETNVLKKYKNIWSIINGDVICVHYNFMDYSRWNEDRNAMQPQNLFVLVMKRAMGIVLHSQQDEAPKRRFLMKGHEKEPYKVLPKTLAFSSLDVPPMEKLIDETSEMDEQFITKKWTLLFWILHLDLDDEVQNKIRSLPREIMPVIIAVLFLLREHQITPLEGDAITISESHILKQPPGTDCAGYPTKCDGRTVRIAHLYVYTRVVLNRCFQICGIDLFRVPVSFDGVDYHHSMNEFVESIAAFEERKAEIKGFQVEDF